MLKSAWQNHYTQSQQTCEKFQFVCILMIILKNISLSLDSYFYSAIL